MEQTNDITSSAMSLETSKAFSFTLRIQFIHQRFGYTVFHFLPPDVGRIYNSSIYYIATSNKLSLNDGLHCLRRDNTWQYILHGFKNNQSLYFTELLILETIYFDKVS